MADPYERNHYDKPDMIRQVGLIRADGLKLAAYRVRDPESGEFGKVQFHMTYDNCVMAIMSEEAAKLFVTFVDMTIGAGKDERAARMAKPEPMPSTDWGVPMPQQNGVNAVSDKVIDPPDTTVNLHIRVPDSPALADQVKKAVVAGYRLPRST